MYELVINGRIVGVFTSSDAATAFAREQYPSAGAIQIFPLGTLLHTDIKEE